MYDYIGETQTLYKSQVLKQGTRNFNVCPEWILCLIGFPEFDAILAAVKMDHCQVQ